LTSDIERGHQTMAGNHSPEV